MKCFVCALVRLPFVLKHITSWQVLRAHAANLSFIMNPGDYLVHTGKAMIFIPIHNSVNCHLTIYFIVVTSHFRVAELFFFFVTLQNSPPPSPWRKILYESLCNMVLNFFFTFSSIIVYTWHKEVWVWFQNWKC